MNAATYNIQLCGHSRTSGTSHVPAYLQVPLNSSSFPGPPSGTPEFTHGGGCTRLGDVGVL